MVLAVVEARGRRDRVTGEGAVRHRLADARFDGGDEPAGDDAALGPVAEVSPLPDSAGPISSPQSANWPRPPDCFLKRERAEAGARIAST